MLVYPRDGFLLSQVIATGGSNCSRGVPCYFLPKFFLVHYLGLLQVPICSPFVRLVKAFSPKNATKSSITRGGHNPMTIVAQHRREIVVEIDYHASSPLVIAKHHLQWRRIPTRIG